MVAPARNIGDILDSFCHIPTSNPILQQILYLPPVTLLDHSSYSDPSHPHFSSGVYSNLLNCLSVSPCFSSLYSPHSKQGNLSEPKWDDHASPLVKTPCGSPAHAVIGEVLLVACKATHSSPSLPLSLLCHTNIPSRWHLPLTLLCNNHLPSSHTFKHLLFIFLHSIKLLITTWSPIYF